MWSERERYISSLEEIEEYLKEIDYFHDYRIGNIHYSNNQSVITVEEIIKTNDNTDDTGLIWDFKFEAVQNFEIYCDCVVGFYINEITIEGNRIIFNCDNGTIAVDTSHVQLGVPKIH